jgi:hypothetical protein
MGIYIWTAVYTGRLLSQEAYNRLRGVPKDWITRLGDPRGRFVLHAPGAFHVMGTMSAVLEQREIDQGFVEMMNLIRKLGIEEAESLLVEGDVADELQEYVRRASDGGSDSFRTYVVQAEYWSYDEFRKRYVTHNIVAV